MGCMFCCLSSAVHTSSFILRLDSLRFFFSVVVWTGSLGALVGDVEKVRLKLNALPGPIGDGCGGTSEGAEL